MRTHLGFPELTPNITRFLIIIIASYLIFALVGDSDLGSWAYKKLILDPYKIIYSFEIWRLFSYGFLHDSHSPFHVIMNSLLLYMLGPEIENLWGEKKFFVFSLISLFMGGIFVCLAFILGLSHSMVMGFSAVTIGLLVAWGVIFSQRVIYIFGMLPVTGKQMVFLTIGLEVFYSVSSSNISSAAHFGGICSGLIFGFELYKKKNLKTICQKFRRKI